jgi:cytochrome c biogenesis protein CcmG, thiol:disulfide interchange protein DsbE
MTSTSQKPRPGPTSARGRPPSGGRRGPLVVGAVIAVVLVALLVAVAAGTGDEGGDGGDRTVSGAADDGPVTVTGDALTPQPDTGVDPAVGRPMPTLSGTGLDGAPVTVPASGRATMVMFVAHWCPHCQAEVPVVQQWIDDGVLPADVDLVTVSTAADDRRPNYPPADWLAGEGWTAPVLADDAGQTAAEAVGLTAFPFFVAVDADGNVVARATGELTPTQLDRIAGQISGTAS